MYEALYVGSCGFCTLNNHFVLRSYRSWIFKVFFCLEILGILDPEDLGSYIFVSSWDPGDPGSSFFLFLWRDPGDPGP